MKEVLKSKLFWLAVAAALITLYFCKKNADAKREAGGEGGGESGGGGGSGGGEGSGSGMPPVHPIYVPPLIRYLTGGKKVVQTGVTMQSGHNIFATQNIHPSIGNLGGISSGGGIKIKPKKIVKRGVKKASSSFSYYSTMSDFSNL